MADSPKPAGLIRSLRELGATLVVVLQNRLDLVSVEASEELFRQLEVVFLGVVFFFLALLGLLVLTLSVLILVGARWQPPARQSLRSWLCSSVSKVGRRPSRAPFRN
jgi:uncharacterized membrane protein YqjE